MKEMVDLGAGSSNPKKKPKKSLKTSKARPEKEPVDVPEDADHYQKFWTDLLGEVINQGFRRTCWTIASTRNFLARLLAEKKADPPLSLSALHVFIGLFVHTDDKGGLQRLELLRTFLKEHGTLLEEDCNCVDPFSKAKSKSDFVKSKMAAPALCTTKGQPPKRMFKVKDLVILDKVDEKELIRLIDEDGPVAVTVDFTQEFEKFSGDGFYNNGGKKTGKSLDKHMLLLYGYGSSGNQHFWKCQNSAGIHWGDQGEIKILRQVSRGKGQPSLFTGFLYPVLLDREAYNPRV